MVKGEFVLELFLNIHSILDNIEVIERPPPPSTSPNFHRNICTSRRKSPPPALHHSSPNSIDADDKLTNSSDSIPHTPSSLTGAVPPTPPPSGTIHILRTLGTHKLHFTKIVKNHQSLWIRNFQKNGT